MKNDACLSGLTSGLGLGIDLPPIKFSQNGYVYTFVCSENQFNDLVKCIKLIYCNIFGEGDKHNVNWGDVRSNAGHGNIVEHLVNLFEVTGDEKNQIFKITMHERLRKVVIQVTHKSLLRQLNSPSCFMLSMQ